MDSIAKRVKAARLHYKYTQKELSEKSGLSQQTINKIEKNLTHIPRKKNLEGLSEALSVPESWLIFGERPPFWACQLTTETSYVYVRRTIPVLGTTDWYSPTPIGHAAVLIDNEKAFGLRVLTADPVLPVRVGAIAAYNPDLEIQDNDILIFANPNEKPVSGILMQKMAADEYACIVGDQKYPIIVNPNDYEICAVLETVGRPRSFTKHG